MIPLALALLAAAPGVWAAPRRAVEPRRKLAGLVVRSREWTVHRGRDTIEEWSGDVSYRRDGRTLTADWAERRHSDDRWRARGHVRAAWRLPDGSLVEAQGEEARHQGDKDAGWLTPKPGGLLQFERRSPDAPEPDRAQAERMDWDMPAHRLRLQGGVRTWGPSGLSWSERADYDTEARRLTLTGGRPVLISYAAAPRVGAAAQPAWPASRLRDWDAAVQADRVTAADEPRRITADGRSHGWVVFHHRPARLLAQ